MGDVHTAVLNGAMKRRECAFVLPAKCCLSCTDKQALRVTAGGVRVGINLAWLCQAYKQGLTSTMGGAD